MSETQFIIIPAHQYNNALLAMALQTPATAKMLHHALGNPTPSTFFCRTCGRAIWWQACPTGGWWIHDIHFPDDHDAECGGIRDDDDD